MVRVIFLALAIALAVPAPQAHAALDRNVKTVMITAGYGLVAGTALGLVSYAASRQVRAVPIGASVGLYLGIAVGIYHVLHRDDPNNPLRAELFDQPGPGLLTGSTRIADAVTPPLIDFQLPVFQF